MPDSTSDHDLRWLEFRSQMPVAQHWAYYNHAAVAPISAPARRVAARWADLAAEEGGTAWPEWMKSVAATRGVAARVIGADPSEIALVPNTTVGISLVAEGFPWRPGDNVVTLADEFPSNQYPWLHLAERGVETRRLSTDHGRFDLDELNDLCDQRTRIVAISWIGYSTGFRCDVAAVAEVAHRHGALLFLDAIQGIGAFPLNVRRSCVDFLAADGHKWMLGPEGAGILFVHGERLNLLRPFGIGWNSVVHDHDFTKIALDLKRSAERFEGGTLNTAGFMALGASLSLLESIGITAISERILALTDRACERLAEIGALVVSHRQADCRSGIVSFELPGVDPLVARNACVAAKISLAFRAGRLRISPHAYNNEADLDRLISVLSGLRK